MGWRARGRSPACGRVLTDFCIVREIEPERRAAPFEVTWGAGTAILATVVALAIGLFLALPVIFLDSPEDPGDLSTEAIVVAQLFTVVGFLLAPLWVASQAGGGLGAALRRLGLRAFDSSAIGWIVVAAVAYFAFVIFYAVVFMTPEQEDIASAFGALPVQILLIVIAASVAEEVCFRGMLFGGLRRRMNKYSAALIAALVFGLLHATTGVSAVPPLIAFGFILALLYEKTGSLWPPIILHALNNSLALWALHAA